MLFIGIAISNAGLAGHFNRDAWDFTRRFLIAPALMALLVLPADADIDETSLYYSSGHAGMTNAPVVSKLYHADADYAAIMVTETTVCR